MFGIELPTFIITITQLGLGVTALLMFIGLLQAMIRTSDKFHGNNEDKRAAANLTLKHAFINFIVVMVVGSFAPYAINFAFNLTGYLPPALI